MEWPQNVFNKSRPKGFLSATAKVASITATFLFHIILYPTVLAFDVHIFLTSSSSFLRFNTNQFNDLLPVGLLPQSIKYCTGIAEVKGSNPVQAWIFFSLSFRNCKSCVYDCDNILSFDSSTRSSHIWLSCIHNFNVFQKFDNSHHVLTKTWQVKTYKMCPSIELIYNKQSILCLFWV